MANDFRDKPSRVAEPGSSPEPSQVKSSWRESEHWLAGESNSLRRLQTAGSLLRSSQSERDGLIEILAAAIDLLGADMGTVQLLAPGSDVLHLVAQRGFEPEFLDAFQDASADADSAWGRSLRTGKQVIIEDTDTDEAFARYRAIARIAGFRAVLSTPLSDHTGAPQGIISVYFRSPRCPDDQQLRWLDLFVQLASCFLERCRSSASLQAGEDRLRLAVRASHVGLWDWDLATDQVVYSPEWKALLGYADYEITNTLGEWQSRVHPDDLGPTLDRIRNVIASPESSYEVEFRMRHKDGTWRWIFTRAEVIRDANNRAVRLLGCHLDVTQRRQAEEALREREARLTSILATAADAVITIDRTGAIEDVNMAAEAMFGYEPGELIGRNVSVLMPQPHRDQHDSYIARYLATRETRIIGVGRELLAQRKDGSLFPIELAVSEIDHLQQFTGIVRDISWRKRLEREVLEATSDEQRRIGQDLHDTIGQELTAIGIQTGDLIDMIASDPGTASEIGERVEESVRRCQRHLRAVLQGLMPVAVDGGGLMAALADLAARNTHKGGVRCEFDGPVTVSVADNMTANQLYLIAQEAVLNAVKHAKARVIRVAVSPVLGGGILLRVTDDGRGLPAEPPAGQGLRIMHHRASIINAHLTVGPALPSGTTVTCELAGSAPR